MTAVANPLPGCRGFTSREVKPRPHLCSPLSTVEPADYQANHSNLSEGRVECGRCGKTYCASAVVNDPPQFFPDHKVFGQFRRLFCDHCQQVQCWIQSCDSQGFRFPTILAGPSYLRGRKYVDRFLSKHPHASGVAQSA